MMQNVDIKMPFYYIKYMRTTIRINDALLLQLKKIVLENNKTLSDIVEEALIEKLARLNAMENVEPVKLVTFKGNGLQPGIDLDDSASLLEMMEK